VLLPERAATCAGCGLLCDDVAGVPGAGGTIERLDGACPLGAAWFAARTGDALPPPARLDGREVTLGAALDEAAAILARARAPLVYGLGRASCETQRAAVALADMLGATIDPAGPLLDGAAGAAYAERGASSATLGELRDRAELVVVWRADPAVTHPRLLERLRLPARDRTLVVVDERRTETAGAADVFVELAPGDDVAALRSLNALARDVTAATGAPAPALGGLAGRLRGARGTAIVHHIRGYAAALALNALVRDLCRDGHAVALTLRHEANAAGAEDVLAWQTGFPAAVSLAGGRPRAHPGELSAAAVLARGDADAALVVGSDPLGQMPLAAVERLRAIPLVAIDACATATAAAARVALAGAAPGVHRAGVMHRLDGVPVPLPALLESDRPGEDEIVAAIAGRVARLQREAP
jgi:formylmethanofuran dehydrogenase subunit B